MSTSLLLVFVLMASHAHALSSLANIQQPIPGVNAQALLGRWSTTFRKPPCTYSASREYENINKYLSFDGKNAIKISASWGPKYCSRTFANMHFTPTPGIFLMKDYFGNHLSGRLVVIGTDYKTFIVYWGCPKFSVFGDHCEDPYILADTRDPNPDKNTIAKINFIMMQRFGMSIDQLDKVVHNGACFVDGNKKPF